MNGNISVMIDLQGIWDRMMELREEGARCGKSIAHWRETTAKAEKETSVRKDQLKRLQASIKEKELDLADKESQMKKLEDRRGLIKTEKEMTALDHEYTLVRSARDALEEEIINAMDAASAGEKDLAGMEKELGEMKARGAADIDALTLKKNGLESDAAEQLARFDARINDLSAELRSKFRKIISAKEGKAIARLEENTCGVCHTAIPVHIAMEAARNEKIMNCTNCGRFIYGAG